MVGVTVGVLVGVLVGVGVVVGVTVGVFIGVLVGVGVIVGVGVGGWVVVVSLDQATISKVVNSSGGDQSSCIKLFVCPGATSSGYES